MLLSFKSKPNFRFFSSKATSQLKPKESHKTNVSTLQYDFQSKKYLFKRDKYSSLNEMLKQDFTKAYFIKNFPMSLG